MCIARRGFRSTRFRSKLLPPKSNCRLSCSAKHQIDTVSMLPATNPVSDLQSVGRQSISQSVQLGSSVDVSGANSGISETGSGRKHRLVLNVKSGTYLWL